MKKGRIGMRGELNLTEGVVELEDDDELCFGDYWVLVLVPFSVYSLGTVCILGSGMELRAGPILFLCPKHLIYNIY